MAAMPKEHGRRVVRVAFFFSFTILLLFSSSFSTFPHSYVERVRVRATRVYAGSLATCTIRCSASSQADFNGQALKL